MLELVQSSLNAEYAEQLKLATDLINSQGYNILPFKNPNLTEFSQLSDSQKAQNLLALRAYTEALEFVINADPNEEFSPPDIKGEAQTKFTPKKIDMAQFIWKFLLRMGIVPTDDLFQTIKNEEYIQIYNYDQFQIFRSLRCFDRCSFTLEELTCRTWSDLWERDNVFYYALTGLATQIFKLVKPTKMRLDFPYHLVREVASECLFEFEYKIKSISILTRQKQIQAAVLVEDWRY